MKEGETASERREVKDGECCEGSARQDKERRDDKNRIDNGTELTMK